MTKAFTEDFVTEEVNNIMKTLPLRVVRSGVVVLICAIILLGTISLCIKIPIMLHTSGQVYSANMVSAKSVSYAMTNIRKGQKAFISIIENKKSITEYGFVSSIDYKREAIFISLKPDSFRSQPLNTPVAITIQTSKISLIKEMWH